MANFKYTAIDAKSGSRKEGEMEARDENDVKQKVKSMGMTPLSVSKKSGGISLSKSGAKNADGPKKPMFGGGSVSKKEIAILARQLAVMINSGVSLLRCITVLSAQSENYAMKNMLEKIKEDLSSGLSFSQCLGKFPKSFEKLFVSMVRAGEASGALDVVLNRVATFLEGSEAIKGKVKGAMVYPVIVLTVAGGIVFMLMAFVIPTFAKMFTEAGMKLPPMTQALINISTVFKNYWWAILLGIAGLIFGFKKAVNTEKGRRLFDIFMLKMPLFGNFTRKVAVGRFTRTMATLLDSGVPILQAFDIVADTVGNVIVTDAILGAKGSIKEGNTISKPLAESGQFPLMVTQMIEIGEESGSITKMLDKVADFNEREVEEAIDAMMAAMEPATIVLLAVVIGSIVIALFQPMFMMSDLADAGT